MAIVTTSILVRSSTSPLSAGFSNRELLRKNLEKYLMGGDVSSDLGSNQPMMNNSTSDSSSNKLERNVFSWITDTIRKSFMSSPNKKANHPTSSSVSNIFDANNDVFMGSGSDFGTNYNNPSFDQILELSRRYQNDGQCFKKVYKRL